ncbi:hypothetical protein A8709_10490 [Paenibacillus pectinilyticus]|uniref:Cytosolic protein n=1 Tax=Paenibacillus pectinilyticus TaxID=512399 RepID=A0A1C1A655_9BACL|nr:hypothetical protein [Paenibacillus pectinilyticus]OCT16035.1 hypothetical protein A8709_10490 [Paenibacillus pectinilyticus]
MSDKIITLDNEGEYPRNIPDFQLLSTKKPEEWTEIELLHLHRTMSDLSPWLHEQDSAMHNQITREMERRGI